MRLATLLITVLLWFWGCKNTQQEKISFRREQLWAEYKIWAEEGDSMATCLLQFYNDPQKRQAIRLVKPATVSVDGAEIEGDSAGISGVFYEYHIPLASSLSRHVITLVDDSRQVFTDSFDFYSFRLSPLTQSITVQDLHLQLEGLPDGNPVRVVLTDTSLAGFEYNELVQVSNGGLVIKSADLARLKGGFIVLLLSAEEDRHLGSMLQGRISVTYGLTRGFTLVK